MARLGDVCEILDSLRVPITASDRNAGIYPYYGANGIQDYIADYIFDDELVLLAEDGGYFNDPNRPIAYRASGKCWVNNHAHVLKPKAGLNVDYLCYSLMFKDISNIVNGATRKKLTQADMREIEIPIPPIEEQCCIVTILNKSVNLFSLRKQQLSKLDELVKSRFIEMFGDPVTNPKGWPEKHLGELGELNRGVSKNRPRNAPELLGGQYPLIQTGEISNAGLFITDYTSTYSEAGLAQSKMWPKGTLCITIAANIAQTAILEFDACFPDSIVGFIPNERVENIYVHYWFGFFQKILEEQAPQVAQKNINLKILNDLDVMVPQIELQNQFVSFVQQVDKSKFEIQKSLEKLETLKKTLMQQYFG